MSEKRIALVVATDTYADTTLQALAAPAADAAALAEVLGDLDLGGFEVEVLSNGASYEVAERVETVLGEADSSDLVLLHFSCHGIKNASGELFLAAANTKTTRLESTAVKTVWVNALMRRSRARRVVLLLDCCFGGAFDRGFVPRADTALHVAEQLDQRDLGGGRGHIVITASSATEYALEDGQLSQGGQPQPSLFTRAVVEGIATGAADRDQDGLVDLNELYEYVYERVRATTPRQTPERSTYGQQGSLFIARNPRHQISASPLLGQLATAVTSDDKFVLLGAVRELARIATEQDLPIAAGAAQALKQLTSNDRRSVASDAAAALATIRPTFSVSELDLGQVTVGREVVPAKIRVEGAPLARASVVTTTTKQLRARIQGDVLVVQGKFVEPGTFRDTVVLTGVAGEATLAVTAEVVDETSRSSETVATTHAQGPKPIHVDETRSVDERLTLLSDHQSALKRFREAPSKPFAYSAERAAQPKDWRAVLSVPLKGPYGLLLTLGAVHKIEFINKLGRQFLYVDGSEIHRAMWYISASPYEVPVTDWLTQRVLNFEVKAVPYVAGLRLYHDFVSLAVDGMAIPITKYLPEKTPANPPEVTTGGETDPMPEVGDRHIGTVVATAPSGALVSLPSGREGVLHISKLRTLSGDKRVKNVEDVLSVGQRIHVEIAEIDGKLSLLVPVAESGDENPAESNSGPEER